MSRLGILKSLLVGGAVIAVATQAHADSFNIPSGDLGSALSAYSRHTGIELLYLDEQLKGIRTRGVQGDLTATAALSRILAGTGFTMQQEASAVAIVRGNLSPQTPIRTEQAELVRIAAAPAHAATGVETVVVTSSKIKGDIQTVPIAITALSQEQLTSRQIAGGPDLVKEVPNLTFSKTNFSGYTIQIRGIGTQAISVTTDPAVAVALNDIPFIRNHFFEQEFFDVNQVEVLRGPQGTLYGRNATAGVVNVVTAKPTDQFEAMLSADWGNYTNRRYEGMVNIPIVDDRLDLRVAGEWTKRDGYTTNEITGSQVDGRDLWSTRVTLGWKPSENVQADLVWEHFQESDDRMRTAKQLCKTDPGPSSVLGVYVPVPGVDVTDPLAAAYTVTTGYLSQGCLPASLYSPESFEVPNGFSLPYVVAGWIGGGLAVTNPYSSTTQSPDLRDIATQINPRYNAKNDTLELNVDYNITPAFTFTSQTGYNQDFLFSTEDYNRFNTAADVFSYNTNGVLDLITMLDGNYRCDGGTLSIGGTGSCPSPTSHSNLPTGSFCDPQLGCSTRIVAQDISREHAWQLSQEFRLASNFSGPFNFSVGGNYMHYETVEDYYVFVNTLSMFSATYTQDGVPWSPGVQDNHHCQWPSVSIGNQIPIGGEQYSDPSGISLARCPAIDTASLLNVNNAGHNYFLSRNPYVLSSYAAFGETYYDVTNDVKLTGGLRWTSDHKHFLDIPSELLQQGAGYPVLRSVDQQWNQLTGRLAANWTPKLDFTDQTLFYGSFAHGYKAGGANPPGANIFAYNGGGVSGVPVHPLIFKPEFVDAYELGSKNTLLDGGLTLNGDVFFYNYSGYQISEIVDRTSINLNFNATVKGAELEAMYEPLPGLKFNFAGGYEDTRIDNGQSSVDLMDRTAGHPGWVLMRPFVTNPSNCVLPDYVVASLVGGTGGQGNRNVSACADAYNYFIDPITQRTYQYGIDNNLYPHVYDNGILYPGFDPLAGTEGDPYTGQNTYNGFDYGPVPNGGAGFSKNLGGNQLPNAPHFTTSLSAEYTMPVSEDWAATLHSDFYWQSQSFARVFNDRPYDKLRGYSNVNLALILTSAQGWQVMGYLKNVFDTTAITGTFLNSDDSGLTTNVFLTDPRLFGVRVTKNW